MPNKTPDEVENLAECITERVVEEIIKRDRLGFIPDQITIKVVALRQLIKAAADEWFTVEGEDQTAGMPEYSNHRY